MSDTEVRKKFEEWAKSVTADKMLDFTPCSNGCFKEFHYESPETAWAYEAWKTAYAAGSDSRQMTKEQARCAVEEIWQTMDGQSSIDDELRRMTKIVLKHAGFKETTNEVPVSAAPANRAGNVSTVQWETAGSDSQREAPRGNSCPTCGTNLRCEHDILFKDKCAACEEETGSPSVEREVPRPQLGSEVG